MFSLVCQPENLSFARTRRKLAGQGRGPPQTRYGEKISRDLST
jgi:hypothetical protein